MSITPEYWATLKPINPKPPRKLVPDESERTSIKDWMPEDRPREKLLLKGKEALTDAELIAILLGSGTASCSAVDLAKKILHASQNNLNMLAQQTATDLMRIKGVGMTKAVSMVAALELGRRRKHQPDDKPRIAGSRDAYDCIKGDLLDQPKEIFMVLLLNRANKVIRKCIISQGGVSGTVADPKIIFKLALESLACGIILAHNHPSGNLKPSQADRDLTQRMKEGGRLLDMQVLDHLIISEQNYFSFADEGLM